MFISVITEGRIVVAKVDEEDRIVIGDQATPLGAEVLVRGKRGKFRYKGSTVTSGGRVVIDTIGPIGIHQAFRSFYLEDIRPVPVPRTKRKYARRVA